MKILLDTHAVLWLFAESPVLTDKVKKIYLDKDNRLFISAASYWEIAIKKSLGKLVLKDNWHSELKKWIEENSLPWLPISAEHCYRVSLLPLHHRDPFDRMLVSQALAEEMTLLTRDQNLKDYGVECIW